MSKPDDLKSFAISYDLDVASLSKHTYKFYKVLDVRDVDDFKLVPIIATPVNTLDTAHADGNLQRISSQSPHLNGTSLLPYINHFGNSFLFSALPNAPTTL